jgi:low affinity Fe/Cu permease
MQNELVLFVNVACMMFICFLVFQNIKMVQETNKLLTDLHNKLVADYSKTQISNLATLLNELKKETKKD